MTALDKNPLSTLADEMMQALPALLQARPEGAPLKLFAAELAADHPSVRRAAEQLNKAGRADLMCQLGSRELFLAPLKYRAAEGRHVCAACGALFDRPKTRTSYSVRYSDRRTCSGFCHGALGWRPESNARRRAAISGAKSTPAALERLAEHNRKRWSKPGERERMSEQNRRQWADPVAKARRAQAIKARNGTPEKRQFYSELRRRQWKEDPEFRRKTTAAMTAAHSAPEQRRRASERMKERWRDPEWRAKWLKAARRNGRKAAAALRGRKQSPEHIAARVAARKAAKTLCDGAQIT